MSVAGGRAREVHADRTRALARERFTPSRRQELLYRHESENLNHNHTGDDRSAYTRVLA